MKIRNVWVQTGLFVVLSIIIFICLCIIINAFLFPVCEEEEQIPVELSDEIKEQESPDIVIFCCKKALLNDTNLRMKDIDSLAIAVDLVCKCKKAEARVQ